MLPLVEILAEALFFSIVVYYGVSLLVRFAFLPDATRPFHATVRLNLFFQSTWARLTGDAGLLGGVITAASFQQTDPACAGHYAVPGVAKYHVSPRQRVSELTSLLAHGFRGFASYMSEVGELLGQRWLGRLTPAASPHF
jgi:hypothetical protein